MSQIIFHDGDKEIMTGYDRPLNYIHLTVWDKDENVIYAELDNPDAFSMDVNTALLRLDELGINIPDNLEHLLRDHVARRAGNERIVL